MVRTDSVSALIIGNEVLTSKVVDANGAHLIARLRARGVNLHSIHFVRDEVDEIVEQIVASRRRARFIITSGGVGPTHDDVTVRAVAMALQRPVVRLAELEARISAAFSGRVPKEALRMAEAPQGSRLLPSEDSRFPVLECDGVFLLPGVPQLFKLQLEAVVQLLPGRPMVLRQLFVSLGEAQIAHALDAVAMAQPHVALGSYPTWGAEHDYRVRLTVEHESEQEVETMVASLQASLGNAVVRCE